MDGLLLKLINDLVAAGQAILAYAILFFLAYRLLIAHLNSRQKTNHYRAETNRESEARASSIFEMCMERMDAQQTNFLNAYDRIGTQLEKVGAILSEIQKDIYVSASNTDTQNAIAEVTEHTFRVTMLKEIRGIHQKIARLENGAKTPVCDVAEVLPNAVHN